MSITSRKAFSLIEVLIFVTILSIFLITAAAIITVSMRQNTLRINMIKASHYNDLVMEWIRGEKETDWRVFTSEAGNSIVCFETESFSWLKKVASKDDCTQTLGGVYRTYGVFKTTLSGLDPTQVEVTLYTEWLESGNMFSTKLSTLFTLWE